MTTGQYDPWLDPFTMDPQGSTMWPALMLTYIGTEAEQEDPNRTSSGLNTDYTDNNKQPQFLSFWRLSELNNRNWKWLQNWLITFTTKSDTDQRIEQK